MKVTGPGAQKRFPTAGDRTTEGSAGLFQRRRGCVGFLYGSRYPCPFCNALESQYLPKSVWDKTPDCKEKGHSVMSEVGSHRGWA